MGKCIILGDNYYNTYGILRSLGEVGIKPIYINVCQTESWVAKTKYYSYYHQVSSYEDGIEYIINNYSTDNNKSLIITTSDKGINCIDKYKYRLADKFVYPHVSDKFSIEQLLNKHTQCILAQKTGFKIPNCLTVSPGQHIEDYKTRISYPCHLKPLDSLNGMKQDMIICHSFDDLQNSINGLLKKKLSVVIQDYIDKEYEIVVLGCALASGEIVVPGTIIKTKEWPYRGVTSTTIMKRGLINVSIENIKRFIALLGYYGIFSMEFAVKNNCAYFLEINLRSDANNYTSTAAGVNIPQLLYFDSLGYDTSNLQKNITKEIKSQVEFVDFDWMKHNTTLCLKWLWDTLTADSYMIFNKQDTLPFKYVTRKPFQYRFLYILYKVINLFKKV